MNRLIILAAAALLFVPAIAHGQATQTARTYQGQDGASKEALGTFCVPDTAGNGCPAGGGGASTPTGTAGSPNAAVVSVQGVPGGTNQNVALAVALPAGTNSLGTVGLNAGTNTVGSLANITGTITLPTGAATQTTLAAIAGQLPASLGAKTTALSLSVGPSTDGLWNAVQQTSALAAAGVAPAASTAVEAGRVAKAGAGNLYGLNVATGGTAGYVLVLNATAIPADGAVTPLKCYALAANTSLDLNLRAAPVYFSTGITVLFSTTGCFTKTASATAFISADAK